ncbi:hypothetical protein Asi03nite_12110 [Actinoplanes siamensis]|uniref:Uncharacterized protein n=1 Tax=Actinoplanes siamensis TaxID=1223317 RepID=A0A919N3F9_9ACTN|nr:hypothetical protein Asi03nite_12110 [Actinoplanes siamensis]
MNDSALFSHSAEPPSSSDVPGQPAVVRFSHPAEEPVSEAAPVPAAADGLFSHPAGSAPGGDGGNAARGRAGGRGSSGRAGGQGSTGTRTRGGDRVGGTDDAVQGKEGRRRKRGGRPGAGRADG